MPADLILLFLSNGKQPLPLAKKLATQWCQMATHIWVEKWLRKWLVVWRHQAITWTNIDLSSVTSNDIHLRAISYEIPQPTINKIILKITHSTFHPNLPGAYELIRLLPYLLFSHLFPHLLLLLFQLLRQLFLLRCLLPQPPLHLLQLLLVGTDLGGSLTLRFGQFLTILTARREGGRCRTESAAEHCIMLTLCGLVMPYGNISGWTLAQVMACCLTASSHYLNQCWLIIIGVLQHAHQSNFIGWVQEFNPQHELENYSLKFLPHHPGVNELTHLSLEAVAVISNVWFSNLLYRNVAWALTMKLHSGDCCPSCNILTQMSQDLTEDKSTLIRVMAWSHQATSYYLNQCWLRSMMPYGITKDQWVNSL